MGGEWGAYPDSSLTPARLYHILAKEGVVRSIDEFLNLTIGQTLLLTNAIKEYYEEQAREIERATK